jgi:hypothetical protein
MPASQPNRFLNAHFHHRANWSPQALQKLYDLCAGGASFDDLTAAFPGWGAATLLTGTRMIITELIRTIDQQSKVP